MEQAKDVATHVAELGEAKENFLQSQAEIGQFQQLAKAFINELMGLGAFFTADMVPMNSLAATSKAEWEAFCKRAGVPADDHACELARKGVAKVITFDVAVLGSVFTAPELLRHGVEGGRVPV